MFSQIKVRRAVRATPNEIEICGRVLHIKIGETHYHLRMHDALRNPEYTKIVSLI